MIHSEKNKNESNRSSEFYKRDERENERQEKRKKKWYRTNGE